jgi:hypothetical protein
MGRKVPPWLADAVKRHAEFWNARCPPPRFATIEIVIDDEIVTLSARISAAKLERLRSFFPGQDDSTIVNSLVDALFAQLGVDVVQ